MSSGSWSPEYVLRGVSKCYLYTSLCYRALVVTILIIFSSRLEQTSFSAGIGSLTQINHNYLFPFCADFSQNVGLWGTFRLTSLFSSPMWQSKLLRTINNKSKLVVFQIIFGSIFIEKMFFRLDRAYGIMLHLKIALSLLDIALFVIQIFSNLVWLLDQLN